MCGRLTQHWPAESWQAAWPMDWQANAYVPRYNVSPGTPVLAVVHNRQGRSVGGLMHWGLNNPKGGLVINARVETLTERPMFRPLLNQGRAVVPMNGYFEWDQSTKDPYYLSAEKAALWALALYRREREGPARLVIVTRPAAPRLESLHPRMPLLADRSSADAWLSALPAEEILAGLLPQDIDHLTVHRVSTAVNSSRHEGAELIRPLSSSG